MVLKTDDLGRLIAFEEPVKGHVGGDAGGALGTGEQLEDDGLIRSGLLASCVGSRLERRNFLAWYSASSSASSSRRERSPRRRRRLCRRSGGRRQKSTMVALVSVDVSAVTALSASWASFRAVSA